MITPDDWFGFVNSFFGVEDAKWLHHVMANWNFIQNSAGCNCGFLYGPVVCEEYTDMMRSQTGELHRIIDEETVDITQE